MPVVPSPFPKSARKYGRWVDHRPRRQLITHLEPTLGDWFETRAKALGITPSRLLAMLTEFYRAAVVAREVEIRDEIIKIFPPGTNGLGKPFATSSDAFRENIG